MPDPQDIEDMPEPDEFDEDELITDYDSPYPIDDRHMMDSIYRVSITNNEALAEIYSSYKTAKLIASLILSTIFAGIFAVILLTLAGVI